jgi:processive 1,2-diacylglycerol beta-glucosyltransferase
MSLRILVLTSSTGSGHDMRARAFTNWAELLYGDQVEVRIERIIENGSLLGRFGVWVYNTIHQYAPFLHNIYFFIVELFVFSHSRSVSFGGRYYRRLLADFRPDIVFSVHDSTNRGYFEDARRVLGDRVRCVTYCGEFSGGYGYSRNWVNPSADQFIARTHPARSFAIQLGMPKERTSVFHKVLPPEAFQTPIAPAEKTALLRQLGLDPDRFTLFLATGGYGANHHFAFLKALLPLAGQLQVIVVCGRNQRVFEKLTKWAGQHPRLTAYIEGYSTQMSEFFQVSHAVVTRGGANSTMEALHFGCPLLYDSLGGLMPQEQCTVRYFLDNGAARLIRKPDDLTHILKDWSRLDREYQDVLDRLNALQHEENPRDLLRTIMGPMTPAREIS